MDQVEDGAHQDTGADTDGFTWLEVDLDMLAPALAEACDDADEAVEVVVGVLAGNLGAALTSMENLTKESSTKY